MIKIAIYLTMVFLWVSNHVVAQDDIFGLDNRAREKGRKSDNKIGNVTRSLVSLISVEFGAGAAYHQNSMLFNSENSSQYPIVQTQDLDFPRSVTANDTLSFRSVQSAIPMHIAANINLFNTITLGGGYGREIGRMDNLQANPFELVLDHSQYTFDKVFGTVGLVLYDARKRAKFLNWKYRKYASQNFYMQSQKNQRIRQNYPWRFMVEGQFGNIIIRNNISPQVNANSDPFYNVSFRVERDFSEYARLFVKAGYESRNFIFQGENPTEFQNLNQVLYPIQIGLSVSLPGTKRCKKPGCGVVMRHLHDGVEYRGSSIFQLQNRKVGQWY
ncbi:hypothetical protein IPZ59_16030 [Mongoliitalea daihaiensis]|nr:hypothetical protein IPZ59_16030 [Mongoliitalea daihaiensis]